MSSFLYLIQGCANSDRRTAVFDLLRDTATTDDPWEVYISDTETPSIWNEQIAAVTGLNLRTYEGNLTNCQLDPNANSIVIANGRQDPMDQIEFLKDLLESSGKELGRIITLLDCELLHNNPGLRSWYTACIHFSDVLLLSHRQNLTNQHVQDILTPYQDDWFPFYTESLKKGRVRNPNLILEPQARRISLLFEPDEDIWLDEDVDPMDGPEEDIYLKKFPDGNREIRIRDISKFLD